MRNIARLSDNDRRELFRNTADKMGLNDAIVEKGFWVCFTLDFLFHRSLWKESITFKGGTSLSKAFHLITRHQNEVKFMSASLQYSNYTGQADFAVPYSIMTAPAVVRELYLKSCHESMKCYETLCTAGSGHDAAGYATPQGLRNVLLISATPYQWKHIISQRVCRRNTDETRIVLLKVWKELYELSPALFAPSLTGPFCQMDRCLEGKMTCGRKLQADMTPEDILEKDYPALWEGGCR